MKQNDTRRARQANGDRVIHAVDLPELRCLGPHQPVILVADDEPFIRNLVTLLMQYEGYFVLSAADGHEGLELARRYPGTIDLVITDVNMPRMNGSDLCSHLIQERPGIKMLMMSGADMNEIISQNENLPFLPKPFDGQTLIARVKTILSAAMDPTAFVKPAVMTPHGSPPLVAPGPVLKKPL